MSQVYLSGPSIVGLYGMFEENWGDPSSPKPYPRVTPTRVGAALLPFRCPRCETTIDFSDPKRREHYHDTRRLGTGRRDNYFCPSCGMRFLLNDKGKQLEGKVSVDGAAPSTVETITIGADGLLSLRRTESHPAASIHQYLLGCDVLGSS